MGRAPWCNWMSKIQAFIDKIILCPLQDIFRLSKGVLSSEGFRFVLKRWFSRSLLFYCSDVSISCIYQFIGVSGFDQFFELGVLLIWWFFDGCFWFLSFLVSLHCGSFSVLKILLFNVFCWYCSWVFVSHFNWIGADARCILMDVCTSGISEICIMLCMCV